MPRREPTHRLRAALLLLAIAVTVVALGRQSTPSSAAPGIVVGPPGALGAADGAIPDGTTVADEGVPGVAGLDPALLRALRRASSDAGIAFLVDSGRRSAAYQQHLLDEAVVTYGSEAEAARWVASPTTSAHVSGDAVDLGSAGAGWLAEHGAAYGLCPTYLNEPWHYELRPGAEQRGCPQPFADPTHDPRMAQR